MIYRAIYIDEKNKFFNRPAERQLYNKSAFRQEEFKKEILPIQNNITAERTHHISTTLSVHVR